MNKGHVGTCCFKVLLVNTDYQDASEGSCVQSTLGSFGNISSLVFV